VSGPKVWLNGAIIDADQAHIAITDRGFTLGDGLFETMLWTGAKVRFLPDHLARLQASAAALGLTMPFPADQIEAALLALAGDFAGQTAALRLTLTRGSGQRGLGLPEHQVPQMLATIAAYSPTVAPVTLASVSIARNVTAPSARHKTLSYIDNILALDAARDLGADDAIMPGTTGNIACASSANIVIRYHGQTLTPRIEDGALPGIVRGRLIVAGLAHEVCITCDMLAGCDDAALTNALIGVRAIATVDGRLLGADDNWVNGLRAALLR
jgi:branched-chain amino acid aminotransferase